MKKLDFIEALNHLSDETVAEAAADETSKEPDKKPFGTFLKYGAAAACAALAIFLGAALSKNIKLEKQMPDVAERSETAAVLPEVSENDPTTKAPASSLPTVKTTVGEASLGDEVYSAGDVSNLDCGNPWRQLEISEGDTLPVYERVMRRNFEQNGMIENVDRDFMLEALRFYAVGFGFDPDEIEIKDNRLTPEELEKLSKYTKTELSEEYAEPTMMSFEKNGVKVEIRVTDALLYRADISIDGGFELPDGAKVGFWFGASRKEAENAAPELLVKYEWLLGKNKAGKTAVNASQSENCYVGMYHPCFDELATYDDDAMTEIDREDIVKTIINFSLNNIDFMDDGEIICYGVLGAFEKQYRKIGDYPAITLDEALGLLDSGGYVWTPFEDSGRTSKDVEYAELVYGGDGVPYYKFYCSAAGWRGNAEGDYGVYYVPAIEQRYVEGE